MGTPPKRTIKNMKKQDQEKLIAEVSHEVNQIVLRICRLNILTASHRTTMETQRSDMMNPSDKAVTHFPASPYTAARDKPTIFMIYAGYWMGQVRQLRMLYANDGSFKKNAWHALRPFISILKQVSVDGLDAIKSDFNEDKQQYTIRTSS